VCQAATQGGSRCSKRPAANYIGFGQSGGGTARPGGWCELAGCTSGLRQKDISRKRERETGRTASQLCGCPWPLT